MTSAVSLCVAANTRAPASLALSRHAPHPAHELLGYRAVSTSPPRPGMGRAGTEHRCKPALSFSGTAPDSTQSHGSPFPHCWRTVAILFRRRSNNRRRSEAIEALASTPTEELVERRAELQAAAENAGLTPNEIGAVLNARPELPRPLLPIERDTLLAILGYADFEGRDELLARWMRRWWMDMSAAAAPRLA